MRFLDSESTSSAVSNLVGDAKSLRAAVAYWGEGATERLRDTVSTKDVVLVCDLMSGCCNPREIRRLRKAFGEGRVLTRDRLHAKVWLTDKSVIIGSSNASANGLAEEGNEAATLIEANLQVEDPDILRTVREWFERQVMNGSRRIGDEDLKVAKGLWEHQRATRTRRKDRAATLLDALKCDPAAFQDRNAIIWIYKHEGLSREAKRLFEQEQKKLNSSNISCWENERLPIGSYVLDFDSSGGRPELDEGKVWQVLYPVSKAGRKGSILLCKPVSKIFGLRLGDRRTWENAAKRAADRTPTKEKWDLASFARRYLS